MVPFDRDRVKASLANLAQRGVFLGTSSWKYAGWCGMLYDPNRYLWKGKLSDKRFEENCLSEYAEVFRSVCLDAAYYKFPTHAYLDQLFHRVPDDFRFSMKVTDEITVKRFTNLPRFGARAGAINPNFLNPDLFVTEFLGPCAPFQRQIGVLIFEFSKFYRTDFARGRDFMQALDDFFSRLPSGWRFGVEIRNRTFLQPEYFAMLARHGVAHVFNSWTAMPTVTRTASNPRKPSGQPFLAARFLLRPGRSYQQALNEFGPYDQLKEINDEARSAGAELITLAAESEGREEAYIYVNNRLEGNALATITAMIEYWEAGERKKGLGLPASFACSGGRSPA